MSRAARGDRSGDEPSLPRRSQYLAIPLGGLAPAHGERSGMVRAWRRHAALTMTAAGCAAGAAAVLLSIAPRSLSAYADASALHIGGATLHREPSSPVTGYVAYGGDAAVLVAGDGPSSRSAGAATVDGKLSTGWCIPAGSATGRVAERCGFTIGGASVTAVDVFDAHARRWHRTYSDGVAVAIEVPSGSTPVPIPLPVGR